MNFYFFRHHLLVKRCWSVEIFRFVFPVFFDLEQLSLDLVHEWIVRRSKEGSLLGGKDGDLSISGIATYQPSDGLLELKMVRMILDIFALPFSSLVELLACSSNLFLGCFCCFDVAFVVT